MAKGFHLTGRTKEVLRGIRNDPYLNWNEGKADHYFATSYERFKWLAERPEAGKHSTDAQEDCYCSPTDRMSCSILSVKTPSTLSACRTSMWR